MQGQLRDDEVYGKGNSYSAEFWQYDSRLGRRWNVDPVVKHHESGYATFGDNPIMMVDPNGDNASTEVKKNKDGTFKVEDGKNYILVEYSDIRKAKKNNRKGLATNIGDFKGDVVPLPSSQVISAIEEAVKQSNSPSEDDDEGGFHEEGGIWGTVANGNEVVVPAKSGPNAKTKLKAFVDVSIARNPNQQDIIQNINGTYHVHPSAKKKIAGVMYLVFDQDPSPNDILSAKVRNPSGYNIVIGAGNLIVYIHGTNEQNQKNLKYRTKFPLSTLSKFK
jgi:hypothetical protein